MKIPIASHLHFVTFQDHYRADEFVRKFLSQNPQADGMVCFMDENPYEIFHIGSGFTEKMHARPETEPIQIGEMKIDQSVFSVLEKHLDNLGTDYASDFIFHPTGYLELQGYGYVNLIKKTTGRFSNYQRVTITCPRILADEWMAYFKLKPHFITHLG